jgi:hypothetical protein
MQLAKKVQTIRVRVEAKGEDGKKHGKTFTIADSTVEGVFKFLQDCVDNSLEVEARLHDIEIAKRDRKRDPVSSMTASASSAS